MNGSLHMTSDLYRQAELRQSPLSHVCVAAYEMIQGHRRWDTAAKIMRMLQRMEGGQMRSLTCRQLLHRDLAIEIGSYSYGPFFTPGHFPPQVRIGRYTSVGPGVRVFNQNHPLDHMSTHPFFYEKKWGFLVGDEMPRHTLDIGPDVWMGYNAVVTPGCQRIGVGAVIAANAVVTKDVPDFTIMAGVPAKPVRLRFPELVCQAVKNSRWWEHPIDLLEPYAELFTQPADEMEHLPSRLGELPAVDPNAAGAERSG